MKYLSQHTSSALAFLLGALLFGSHFVIGFTEPNLTPPLENVPTPLNTGASGQSKVGGLILNTGGATNGLIVQSGNVGIGTLSPSYKLDVIGYVRGSSGVCIGSDCRTSWPASAGAETDPTVTSSVKDGVSWGEISGKPSESDPTVPSSIKDGISWGEVSGRPSLGPNIYSCPVRVSQGSAGAYAYSNTSPSCDGQLQTFPTCQYAIEGSAEYQVACSFVGKLVN